MKMSKTTMACLVCVVALAALTAVYAMTAGQMLTQTINYTKRVPEVVQISWAEDATVNFEQVDVITKAYTISNTGNVPVVVTASVDISPLGSATATWDNTTATIAVGEQATFTLTLNVASDGSATVNFSAVKAE